MLARCLTKRLYEEGSHMLDRSETRFGSHLLQRHIRFQHQPPRPFELCVTYCGTDSVAEGGGETGFESRTRDGDCIYDMRNFDALCGVLANESHRLCHLGLVDRQDIGGLPRDDADRIDD